MQSTTIKSFNILLALCGILFLTFPTKSMADNFTLFGSREMRSTNISPFTKWTEVLTRHESEYVEWADKHCNSGIFKKCHVKDWLKFVNSQRGKSVDEMIHNVQKHMNKVRYVTDISNWGVSDYWASPRQFFIKNGDCEDYSIAKYMSLKMLGIPDSRMRIVILRDHNLGVLHAVLAVRHNGRTYILDNQISDVVESKKVRHYEAIYSINEYAWWRHSMF